MKSDGTSSGTVQVKDIYSGVGSSYPTYLTNLDGNLYFVASEDMSGKKLWKTDGTSAGTVQIYCQDGYYFDQPRNLISYNGKIYFAAIDEIGKDRLWVIDGTPEGTKLAYSGDLIMPASINYLNFNDNLYFGGIMGESGSELFKFSSLATSANVKTDLTSEFELYPNPAHNYVNIKSNEWESKKYRYKLIDINGKVLIEGNISSDNFLLSLQSLKPSVYSLKVYDNKTLIKIFKIIKE